MRKPEYIMDYDSIITKTNMSLSRVQKYMPLQYRHLVYSMSRDIHEYDNYRYNMHGKKSNSNITSDTIPPGFARECLMDFIKMRSADWFIERGIAINVETHIDIRSYQYRANLIAHMTPEQKEEWREQLIIDKLQNSFKKELPDDNRWPF